MKRSVKPFEHLLKIGKLERKEYQMEGVSWMLDREEDENIKGGILADEMGLGKTIQVLGTILCNCKLHTLIVLPVTLLEQWYNTIYYFTGHKAVLFHGSNRPTNISNSPIVLTTYHLVGKEEIQSVEWDRVVFDEAHHLRNPKTKINESVGSLKRKITWLITGTPIQNKTKDIITLFKVLGVKRSVMDITLLCMEFLLKRTKKEVDIVLPTIKFHDIMVEWNQTTKEKELAMSIHTAIGLNRAPTTIKDSSVNRWVSSLSDNCVLPLYTKCKQLCVMPSIMKVTETNMDTVDIEYVEECIQTNDKLDLVVDHLVSTSKDVKKMVFCNFRKEMDYLKSKCLENNRNVSIIDGRTSYSKKSDIFSELPEILILQVYTCCEGLNLQPYTRIYFASPQWNPSIEDQAVARCHRVGQTNEVDIYHFKMAGVEKEMQSLEGYICKVQEEKRKLYI